MQLGQRSALWMALFGYLAIAVHRHLDTLDRYAMHAQDYGICCLQKARLEALAGFSGSCQSRLSSVQRST